MSQTAPGKSLMTILRIVVLSFDVVVGSRLHPQRPDASELKEAVLLDTVNGSHSGIIDASTSSDDSFQDAMNFPEIQNGAYEKLSIVSNTSAGGYVPFKPSRVDQSSVNGNGTSNGHESSPAREHSAKNYSLLIPAISTSDWSENSTPSNKNDESLVLYWLETSRKYLNNTGSESCLNNNKANRFLNSIKSGSYQTGTKSESCLNTIGVNRNNHWPGNRLNSHRPDSYVNNLDLNTEEQRKIPYIDASSTESNQNYTDILGSDIPESASPQNNTTSSAYDYIDSKYIQPANISNHIWRNVQDFKEYPFCKFYTKIFSILKAFCNDKSNRVNMFSPYKGLGKKAGKSAIPAPYKPSSVDFDTCIPLSTEEECRSFINYIKYIFATLPPHLFETMCIEQDVEITCSEIRAIINMLHIFDESVALDTKVIDDAIVYMSSNQKYILYDNVIIKNIKHLVKAEVKAINTSLRIPKGGWRRLVSCGRAISPSEDGLYLFLDYFWTVKRLIDYMNVQYELNQIGAYTNPLYLSDPNPKLRLGDVGRDLLFWLRKRPENINLVVDMSEVPINKIPIHIFMIPNITGLVIDFHSTEPEYLTETYILSLMRKVRMMRNISSLKLTIDGISPFVLDSALPGLLGLTTLDLIINVEMRKEAEYFIMRWIGDCKDLMKLRISVVGMKEIPATLRRSLMSLEKLTDVEIGADIKEAVFRFQEEDVIFLQKIKRLKAVADSLVIPPNLYEYLPLLESYTFTYTELIGGKNGLGVSSEQKTEAGKSHVYENVATIVNPKKEEGIPQTYRTTFQLRNTEANFD